MRTIWLVARIIMRQDSQTTKKHVIVNVMALTWFVVVTISGPRQHFFNFHSAHATGKHSQFKTDNFLHTVYWIPPYWDTLVYIRIAMILPRRNITCSDGGSQNSVGEVEKTRLRLPGTSVMSLSSPAHLRLLIAALAILMLPWSPPLTAFEGCASTQAFGRQTSNLHPKANKSKLFKGEVPKILKIPPLQRRGKVFLWPF